MNFGYLDSYIDSINRDKHIPAVGITVYKHGRHLHTYATGYANIDEKKPFTADTLVNLYSCTKISTATAGMKLVSEGKLNLDAPVSDYIPEAARLMVKTPDRGIIPAKNVMTVRHLFSMSGGLYYDMETDRYERLMSEHNGNPTTVDVARALLSQPLIFEPGTHFKYSFCLDVLGAVIELSSGMKFSDYLRTEIFEPLGMNDTMFKVPEDKKSRMAPEYHAYNKETGKYDVCIYKYGLDTGFGENMESGGGGLVSTINDYGKLAAMLSNGGVGENGARILPPSAIDMMRENQLCRDALRDFEEFGGWSKAGYGYGLGVRTLMDRERNNSLSENGEFGWDGALGCYLVADPKTGIGIFYAQQEGGSPWWTWHNTIKNTVYACAVAE